MFTLNLSLYPGVLIESLWTLTCVASIPSSVFTHMCECARKVELWSTNGSVYIL